MRYLDTDHLQQSWYDAVRKCDHKAKTEAKCRNETKWKMHAALGTLFDEFAAEKLNGTACGACTQCGRVDSGSRLSLSQVRAIAAERSASRKQASRAVEKHPPSSQP